MQKPTAAGCWLFYRGCVYSPELLGGSSEVRLKMPCRVSQLRLAEAGAMECISYIAMQQRPVQWSATAALPCIHGGSQGLIVFWDSLALLHGFSSEANFHSYYRNHNQFHFYYREL